MYIYHLVEHRVHLSIDLSSRGPHKRTTLPTGLTASARRDRTLEAL